MSDNQSNQAAKFSDLIAVLYFKVSLSGKLSLGKDETTKVLSILKKTRDRLTELELQVEKLKVGKK